MPIRTEYQKSCGCVELTDEKGEVRTQLCNFHYEIESRKFIEENHLDKIGNQLIKQLWPRLKNFSDDEIQALIMLVWESPMMCTIRKNIMILQTEVAELKKIILPNEEVKAERNKVHMVLDIICDLEKRLGKPIPTEEIVIEAEQQGIMIRDTQDILQRLRESGSIFEPKKGFTERIK